jgi:hypothetical protein
VRLSNGSSRGAYFKNAFGLKKGYGHDRKKTFTLNPCGQ